MYPLWERPKPEPCFRNWGAMCHMPHTFPRQRIRWLTVLPCAGSCALLLVSLLLLWQSLTPPQPAFIPALVEAQEQPRKAVEARANCSVSYRYPDGASCREATYRLDELQRGGLLLIDAEHPLPADVPPPNTLAIAAQGKGMIPVRELSAKADRETIAALHQLFYHLRQNQIEGLAVSRGTLSEAEQRDWQLERVKLHSVGMSLEDALATAQREVDAPGQSEHQQGCAVDIRLYPTWSGAADPRPLERTSQGRALLQSAWRYGFIRRYPDATDTDDKACHFRYVGLAHSTAMTWLNLTLEDYLLLLHEKGVIQIHENGIPRYVIVCAPIVDGYASALIPEGTACEASSDNQGYAVIACTYE